MDPFFVLIFSNVWHKLAIVCRSGLFSEKINNHMFLLKEYTLLSRRKINGALLRKSSFMECINFFFLNIIDASCCTLKTIKKFNVVHTTPRFTAPNHDIYWILCNCFNSIRMQLISYSTSHIVLPTTTINPCFTFISPDYLLPLNFWQINVFFVQWNRSLHCLKLKKNCFFISKFFFKYKTCLSSYYSSWTYLPDDPKMTDGI